MQPITHRPLPWLTLTVALTLLSSWPTPTNAAGRVELELVTEERVAITSQQEWLRRLSQAGIANFRIRSKGPLDQVGLRTEGSPASPVYRVTGLITANDELLVPGERFRSTDVGRLATWLNDLAQKGPLDQRETVAAFGLTSSQLKEIHIELSRPVGFDTSGLKRADAIERIAAKLLRPVRIESGLGQKLEASVIAEDLSAVSRGTALAYIVRFVGASLVPRSSAGRPVEYTIVSAAADQEAWPVGWKPEKPTREVLPGIFEFLNVNVQGVPVSQVLTAVGGRLKVPLLTDHNALARHGIEPDKVIVNLPQSRTTYSLLLSKSLFQARLKSELRQDEADRPFIWVTSLKPM